MDKENVVYLNLMEYSLAIKITNFAIFNNRDGPQGNYAE